MLSSGTRLFEDPGLLAQAIVAATDDVIFAKDLEGRYRFANPATLAIFNLPLDQVLGRTDRDLMPIEQALRVIGNDLEVIVTGRVQDFDEAISLPNGAAAYWHTRKMPLRSPDGQITGVLGIARDVTDRKLAESQVAASRLKLQMGVQAAGLVMAEIDYRTNQNRISAELARLLELGDGEMVVPRQAIFDRIHPDDRQRYLDAIARTVDPKGTGHLAIDVRALLPSGTVRWLHIRLQVIFTEQDGELRPDRGICAARDVTTEMLAERKLHAAQRLTQSVIEGAGSLVFAKDLQGRYILSNQAWRSQFGFTRETAYGVTDDQIFGPEVAARLRANDERIARTCESETMQEWVILNGQCITYSSSKFPLYDDTGQVYAVCGVSTDITEVVEADRRKDEFIAMLAHELRNPLAPIRTGLEILRRVDGMPPAAARTRDMMQRQLEHMIRLVDDLLDVSRISRGKLELRSEAVPAAQVIQHAVEASQPALEAANHAVAVVLPGPEVRVHGDLTRLAQVVSNLVNNAGKYTPPGGHIRVEGRLDAQHVVIEVADDGVGIEPAMLPHVFDLFAQADNTRRRAQGGLGIGLWLVRRIVEMHEGTVEARSDGTGKGSSFRIRLPVLRG